jgi:voltage-gated potassium channel Kch
LGKLYPAAMAGPARMQIGLLVLTFTLILYGCCGALMLSAMLKAREVTHQIIISAVNLYIILGMFYAHIYTILHWFHPESFALQLPSGESASHFVYFSFVTLATLGYGDITPKTELAQRLAITEAIIGQFYGSLVVAYLLSLYIGDRIRGRDTGPNRERRPTTPA